MLPVELDATSARGRQTRLHAIPDQVALELGEAGHDGAHQLTARGADIEAEARLGQDANFSSHANVEGLDEVLRAPAPAAEFGNQDSVDLVGSG